MTESSLRGTESSPKGTASTKREKFVKLAESRTSTAIKAIRIIGKLGNRNAYDYDDADVRKIAKALNDEVEALKDRMKTTKSVDGVDFKL
jgi:hypothetical protein